MHSVVAMQLDTVSPCTLPNSYLSRRCDSVCLCFVKVGPWQLQGMPLHVKAFSVARVGNVVASLAAAMVRLSQSTGC